MKYLIVSSTPNSLRTQVIQALLRNGNQVRQTEIIVLLESDESSIESALLATWANAVAVNDGLRIWGAYEQRIHDETYNQMIFAVYTSLLTGGDAADMVAAARQKLAENETKIAEFQVFNALVQAASDAKFRELVAMALFIAVNKLGKR